MKLKEFLSMILLPQNPHMHICVGYTYGRIAQCARWPSPSLVTGPYLSCSVKGFWFDYENNTIMIEVI